MADDDNEHEIHLSPEDIALYRSISNFSRNQADVENMMRQRPTNMRSREDLMSHMMTAHDMHPLSLQFYSESEHDQVPSLRNRQRNWSGETVPELDHQDLVNWHAHDHTAGEYADDYPHTTLDDEHFHH
jgi:hypothetical protein